MSSATTSGKRPPFTRAQLDAILEQGHLLIEAGAGSGKTTTLVGKILYALGAEVDGHVVERRCELGEIAAITFTTAAAADLRKSLRARLREHSERDADPRWRRLVYEVDRARIGTIHSFCGQVLRECALQEGMDPGFGILDAGEAADLREECARDALHAAIGDGDEDAAELAFQFGPGGAVRMIRDAMEKGDAARQAYATWCDEGGEPRTDLLRSRVEAAGGTWRDHDVNGARLAAAVLRLAEQGRDDFAEALDAQGKLDYDALIYRTRDLLTRSGDALAGLRRRLAWLFIDEFQDTDPAQRDIAYAICGIADTLGGVRGRIGAACPRLCIVGDPKQSIYGFRRADVTLWNAVDRDFRTLGARLVTLDENFRSRAPLLGLVNATFGALMPARGAEAPDHEVRYHALQARRDYAGDDGLVELLELPADETAPERRAEEARLIARRLRAMVDQREPVTWDGEGEKKPASWKDVALLFRSTSDVRIYEAELRRLDVPCWVAAGDGFFATREVRDVRLLLTALTDAHDDVAWVGVLRSPWVGLSDDALLRLHLARGKRPFSAVLDVELPGADGEALAFARGWMEELRLLRDRVSVAALVERALERSGYAAALLYSQGGDVALANVRKLVRMADGRPESSLAEFVTWMRERGESSAREGEAALHTAGEDVVTLTTIHGAKGLEWPVVFLCDLDRGMAGASQAPSLYLDPVHGIGLKLVALDADGEEQPCGAYAHLKERAAERDLAEEKRVWYVASTRARDRLVLCAARPVAAVAEAVDETTNGKSGKDTKATKGTKATTATNAAKMAKAPKAPKQTPALWMLGQLAIDGDGFAYGARWSGRVVAELPEVAAREAPVPPTMSSIDGASSSGEAVEALRRRIAPAPTVPPLFRRSATELMTLDKDADGHRRSYLLGLRVPPFAPAEGAPREGSGGIDARTTGDIVHAIMELHASDVHRDLDGILERELSCRLGPDGAAAVSREARERLRRLVERTRAHAAVKRLFDAPAVERELPFTWLVDHGDSPNVVQGAMDLVARVGGMLEILDFKTHRLQPGEETATAAGYALQRDVYAAALSATVGAAGAFSLFFPETGAEVREALGEAEVAAGRERVCAALRIVAAEP